MRSQNAYEDVEGLSSMAESSRGVHESDPGSLARLMDIDGNPRRVWQPRELRAILRHQLSCPMQFEMSGLGGGLAGKLRAFASSEGLLIAGLGDLLRHPTPPVELLVLTKDFAKGHLCHPGSAFPPEISTYLCFASIAAALTRCEERITELTDDSLRSALQWLIEQPWVDEPGRVLFSEGLDALKDPETTPT